MIFPGQENIEGNSFERQHQEILLKYGREIPDPSPDLSISLVVIQHEELSNNSFWRLLDSVSSQAGVSSEQFEVLLVLNNSKQSAFNRDVAFIENQTTLRILEAIRDGQNNNIEMEDLIDKYSLSSLTNHEVGIMRKSIESKANIFGVDASSVDKSLIKGDRSNPRGIARNIGGHLALERLSGKGDNVLIDFIDGDCYLSDDYFAGLVEASREYPGETIAKPVVSVNPDLPKEIERSRLSTEQKLFATIKYLKSSLFNTRMRFLKHPAISGQQIALSPKTFQDVGGYVTNEHQEDWEFATKVDRVSSILRAPVLRRGTVYLSDRKRPGAVDGFSEGKIQTVKIQELVSKKEDDKTKQAIHQLLEQNHRASSDATYIVKREELFRESQENRSKTLIEFYDVLNKAIEAYSTTIEQMGFVMRSITGRSRFVESLSAKLSDQQVDFIGANPVLFDCLIGVIEMAKKRDSLRLVGIEPTGDSFVDCLELMKNLLPEYFEEPLNMEPNYSEIESGGSTNLADYLHIAQAAFIAHKN